MMRIPIFTAIVAAVLLVTGCRQTNPDVAYKNAMAETDVAARIQAVESFAADFPAYEKIARAYSRLFRDYLEQGQTENALAAADKYLNSYPEDARVFNYNYVAWRLAEKQVALDSARVYAEKAVALARKNQIRQLPMILDTYGYILYLLKDYKTAEPVLKEALKGNDQNGGFLYHYALIQHGVSNTGEALNTVARAILYGAGEEAGKTLREWLNAIEPETVRQETAGKISEKAVTEFLQADDNLMRRSWCALLYAIAGVNLEKAEKWAVQATQEMRGKDPELLMAAHRNLAAVYQTLGRFPDRVAALEAVRDDAMPYEQSYWLELGNAYRETGQPEKALEAYLTGLAYETSEDLMAAAAELEPDGTVLQKKIEATKQELSEFDPGKFDPAAIQTDRVALVELFTGSECPPCLGADEALDKIALYYPRTVLALLEYHLHIPRPDPMTNSSAEERYAYYGQNFGTPTVFFNGTDKLIGGGPAVVIRNLFNTYRKRIDAILEKPAGVTLNCSAELSGDVVTVSVSADVQRTLPDDAQLFIALAERHVMYAGGNGVTKHLFVVRKVLGGAEALKLSVLDGTGSVTAKMDLAAVEAELKQYLDDFTRNPPARHRTFKGWSTRPETLNRENLAVISWLQDPTDKEVIQAVYTDI